MCVSVQIRYEHRHDDVIMKPISNKPLIHLPIRKLILAAIITTLFSGPVTAQEDNTQALIDEMNQLLNQAEKDRSANSWFLREARDILRSYEWPWHETLLDETFRDSEYTSNPAWVVDAGAFRVVRGVGLRTEVTTTSTRPPTNQGKSPDAVSQILNILLQSSTPTQQQAATQSEKAAIHTVLPITNSFLIEVDVSSLSTSGDSTFSFGPYQGDRRDTGYQLVYRGGNQPVIELHRFNTGRSAIVEVHEDVPLLDDAVHTLTWQRRNDGEMTVLMDGSELFTTSDRGVRDPFTGFALVNESGQLGISRIRINGEGK